MDTQEKYALYKEAEVTGGPCEVCGWRDGDGVRSCFYSEEIGVVTHQNSDNGVMASMTEEQRSLYVLHQELVYINEELREKDIQRVAYDHHLYLERMLSQNPDRYPVQDEHGNPLYAEAWIARHRQRCEAMPLATDEKYQGWAQKYWWIPVSYQDGSSIPQEVRGPEYTSEYGHTYTAYMTHVYEVHSCGKGHQYMKDPYWLACTGCDTEIKLWEHGVDYDMG